MLRSSLATIDLKIESIEAEIQRVEVKYPLYARQLRTRLNRYRIQRETMIQQRDALAETADNFSDGGHRRPKK